MMDEKQITKIENMAKWLVRDAGEAAFIIGMIKAGDPLYLDNAEYAVLRMVDNLLSIRRLAEQIQRELGDE